MARGCITHACDPLRACPLCFYLCLLMWPLDFRGKEAMRRVDGDSGKGGGVHGKWGSRE